MATLQKLFFNNRSYRYWTEREKAQRELYMKEEAQQQKELERIYSDMYRWAEDEINRFYGKYATAEGIDITEAKKRVTQLDIEEYEKLAKQYVKDRDFSDRANAEMRLYNATMKINRLEMLKARIGVHLVDGINTIDQYYEDVITDRTRQEIERQAGILGETVSVADTTKRAENIVNASFFNATYSERIWSHQDRLRSMISIELQRGLIAGVGSREMASRIKREFDVSLADAHRLMVTELRRVQTDVAMDSYKESGVERYVYLAVNPRACPICRQLDGKDFAVSEAEPAKNAPPMHPRCHCTTAPYVDEDEYNAWLNYLSQGGRTSDWEQMTDAERQQYSSRADEPTLALISASDKSMDFGKVFGNDSASYLGSDTMSRKIESALVQLQERFPLQPKIKREYYSTADQVIVTNYKDAWLHLPNGISDRRLDDWAVAQVFQNEINGKNQIVIAFNKGLLSKNTSVQDVIDERALRISEGKQILDLTMNNPTATAVHEWGHAFTEHMTNAMFYEDADAKAYWEWYKTLSKEEIRNGISDYASENRGEFEAECFLELQMPNPRPLAVKWWSYMEKVIAKGY